MKSAQKKSESEGAVDVHVFTAILTLDFSIKMNYQLSMQC